MGHKIQYICDVCGENINPPGVANGGWGGHVTFRLITPEGGKGGKLQLCERHARTVHAFIDDLKRGRA